MRDDAKTIEILRSCSNYSSCENCPIGGAEFSYEDCRNVFRDAADAIEELLAEKAKLENSGKLLVAAFDLAKEKLEKYRHAAFVISETCVDESKGHISPEDAIKKIRESIYYDNTASCSDPLEEVV